MRSPQTLRKPPTPGRSMGDLAGAMISLARLADIRRVRKERGIKGRLKGVPFRVNEGGFDSLLPF